MPVAAPMMNYVLLSRTSLLSSDALLSVVLSCSRIPVWSETQSLIRTTSGWRWRYAKDIHTVSSAPLQLKRGSDRDSRDYALTWNASSVFISDSTGGCASLRLVGNLTNYLPVTASGLTSVGFPSVFPLPYRFSPSASLTHCRDPRNPALAFNILTTCALFLVLRPKAVVLYWCFVGIGFWYTALFSEPQATPPPLDVAFSAFLPALFVCYDF